MTTTTINKIKWFCLSLGLLVSGASGAAADGKNEGKVTVDIRYRYEFVDQQNLANDAKASTIRGRFGGITGYHYNTRIGVEIEGVAHVGSDEFNDTINGKTTFPVVADPEAAELNQGYVEFIGIPDTVVKGGRAVQTLDNHRFIGHVGWRQNIQSYDGAFVTNKSLPDTELFYGYIANVNRIFGNKSAQGDWEGNIQLLNAKNHSLPIGTVGGYAYFLDLYGAPSVQSNQTFGGFIKGKRKIREDLTLKWYFEYARQADYGDNQIDYEADYYHIAPALSWRGLTTTVGYEVLGSDNGTFAFRTPLATLHKFNGFADKFLATPNTGLEDFYVDVTYKVKGLTGSFGMFNGMLLKAQYHDFKSNTGNIDYGTEFDFYTKTPIGKGVYIESKYANYQADSFSADTEKYILGVGFKY